MIKIINQNKIKILASQLRAASELSRMKILCLIFDKKNVCVSEIAKRSNLNVAITSHHLQVLAKAKLIVPIRDGKKICYELAKNDFSKDIKKIICNYR